MALAAHLLVVLQSLDYDNPMMRGCLLSVGTMLWGAMGCTHPHQTEAAEPVPAVVAVIEALPPPATTPKVTIAVPGNAVTRDFPAQKDVMTIENSSYSDTNLASDEIVMVGADDDHWVWRSYLAFDLSSIPVGSQIVRAQLRLFPKEVYDGSVPDTTIVVHRVLGAWDESEIIWDRQPMHEYSSVTSVRVPRDGTEPDVFEVTSIVQSWVDAPEDNNGMVLRPEDPGQPARKGWWSTNAEDRNARPPELEVEYAPPR